MARFQNDPFPGVNYAQYLDWSPVTLPSGETFYEVPGHPGYVYDPVASNASGRKVFRQNPKGQIAQQQEQENAQKKAQKLAEQQASPAGQLLPVAGSIGGLVLANELIPQAASPLEELAAAQVKQQLAEKGITAAGSAVLPTTQAGAAAQGALGAGVPAVPTGLSGQVVPVATEPASGFAMEGVGSAGNYLLPAAGALGAYNLATTDVSPVRGTLQGAASGAAIGSYAGPPGAIIGGVIGGGLGLAKSLFGQHESTRDLATRHTKELLGQSSDSAYQGYVSAMRQGFNAPPPDPSKPFAAGKYGTFDEYKAAGLQADDLSGVYGNIKTFGPEWANFTQDQRRQVTQGIIDAGLYQSKKGEVEITDKEAAKKIKDSIISGAVVPKTQAQAAAQGALVPPQVANQTKQPWMR